MTRVRFTAIAALFLLACLNLGCTPTQPTGGPEINIVNNNTNTNNNGNPSASPSPGGETTGTVARVGIGKVGETCPANVGPSGRGDAVKLGCTAFLTCSPYDKNNVEIFSPASIGTAPDAFGVSSGSEFVSVSPHDGNAFNLDATGRAAGAPVFRCTVKGTTSPDYTLQVVQ